MAARRDADEAAKKAGAGKGAAPAKKEETSEDMLDRIKKCGSEPEYLLIRLLLIERLLEHGQTRLPLNVKKIKPSL
jgi:hypothetical protein